MKKIYTLLAAVTICSGSYAQSQRLILAEEFTQASCPPCAQQNPAFNTLLQANKGKVVSIKYQTSWPGVDPMNAENPTEVKTRVDYYAVTGVPTAMLDGVQQTGTSYTGAPANWTQAKINSEYAVTSPISMVVTHHLTPNLDSVIVSCKVKTTAATLTGNLVAHVAIIEEEILFDKAPGTNGELDFYGVMRKMLPNANGTALPASTVMGDSTVLDFAVKMPSYIRNLGKIAVVAFVQDNSTKAVHQTGYSPAQALALDASLKSLSGLPVYQCTNVVTPQIELKNEGANTITSAKINYDVDGNTPSSYDWSGSIASGAVQSVTLPAITINTPGTRFINVAVAEINGVADVNTSNNLKTSSVGIYNTSVAAPLTEDFQSVAFPSNNYVISNPGNDETWNIGKGYGGFATGASQSAIKTLLYYGAIGAKDEIILSKVDLSVLSSSSVFVNFDYAHAPVTATTENDKLEIMTSTDCGTTWTTALTISGATNVFTAAATNYVYNPKASEWKKLSADISSIATSTDALIKFVSTSGKGNNMWIDNINIGKQKITGVADIAKTESSSLVAFPNPAANSTNLSLILTKSGVVNVEILNMLGERVSTQSFSSLALGVNTVTVDLSKLNNGMYIMNVIADGNTSHTTISVEK